MHRLVGCALLGLAVCAAGLAAQGAKDGKKAAKAGNEVVGKVKAVDLDKKSLTITTEAGKDRTFLVDDKTQFVGPRGGVSRDGLKDDRLGKGSEVTVTPAADGRTAREVRLPFRKKAEKGKTGTITGIVTYKGRPLPGGTVEIHMEKGGVYSTGFGADGKYTLVNIPVGKARLAVETESARPGATKVLKLKTPPQDRGLPGKAGAEGQRYVAIPRAYADVKTSGLRFEVRPGKQTLNIQLQ